METEERGELGYFFDSVHGRVSVADLPSDFAPMLKSALRSKPLERLKRINQLGHASLSFFSATHTRFSHSIGTMLAVNRLLKHLHPAGIDSAVFDEAGKVHGEAAKRFSSVKSMVHCHLLLAALYQDSGELPFQKVTSLYFRPDEQLVARLVRTFKKAKPREWRSKRIFTVASLLADSDDPAIATDLRRYDHDFLVYLITGDGDAGTRGQLSTLRQLLDGTVDADRLDYVYRDALATIGSFGDPGSVLDSIIEYRTDCVVVNDPRPVIDFLSTRMRLFTFVYSAVDVRFRQALLRTLLFGYWESSKSAPAFEAQDLVPELTWEGFLRLDDTTFMKRVSELNVENLEHCRQRAKSLLIGDTLDYECRILRKPSADSENRVFDGQDVPGDMFFDLLSDHGHHQLYRPGGIFVKQALTSHITPGEAVPLEECAGAFTPLFGGHNSAILVPNGYYVFLPKAASGSQWIPIKEALGDGTLFQIINWEDARRSQACPSDTWNSPNAQGDVRIGISYCTSDFPILVRVIRELHLCGQRYRAHAGEYSGAGTPTLDNSARIVSDADAVIVLASREYLRRALKPDSHISREVRAMHDRANFIPIIVLAVEPRTLLSSIQDWKWQLMNEQWLSKEPMLANQDPLATATDEHLRNYVLEALKSIGQWKGNQ